MNAPSPEAIVCSATEQLIQERDDGSNFKSLKKQNTLHFVTRQNLLTAQTVLSNFDLLTAAKNKVDSV